MVFSGPLVRSSYMADLVNERGSTAMLKLNYASGARFAAFLLVLSFSAIRSGAWLAPFALTPLLIACAREAAAARRFLLG